MQLNYNYGWLNYNGKISRKEMRKLENSQTNIANNCARIYLIYNSENGMVLR